MGVSDLDGSARYRLLRPVRRLDGVLSGFHEPSHLTCEFAVTACRDPFSCVFWAGFSSLSENRRE